MIPGVANSGGCAVPACAPFWVADATYTAECPGGRTNNGDTNRLGPWGPQITIRRQARSYLSLEHAQAEAQRLAKQEAEMELVCRFNATACVTPNCGSAFVSLHYPPICRTADSTNSQVEADTRAALAAKQAAADFFQ